ncbi:MAG TPA: hypothetical protein ENH03_03355 [Candidatus Bathyarchaeota archaeon]|nr:hypothetical protein [Candidatus Bathyarchaeota archaeon]
MISMPKFVVIADDFTGACDVGVQFRKYGLRTVVITDAVLLPEFEGYEVVVIDSESRNETPSTAYNKVREIAKYLENAKLIYKKIDSTLRGNVGVELDAVIDELGFKAVIVAPSFPAANRVTLNGIHFVNGVPLEKTEFARDPINPVKTSYIPDLIKEQSKKKVGLITLSKVRGRIKSLKQTVKRLIERGYKIIVADAENTKDLRVIAKAALDLEILPCGSAGLAESVSYWLTSNLTRRVIVFSGSANNITLNQIQNAGKMKDIKVFKLAPLKILAEHGRYKNELNRLTKEIGAAFSAGKDVIVTSAESENDVLRIRQAIETLKVNRIEAAEKISSFIGEIASLIAEKFKVAGVMIIGGDTAIKVMKGIKAYGIAIEGEISPGIPYGVLLDGKLNGIPVITKAGGFGQEDIIIRAIGKLKSY